MRCELCGKKIDTRTARINSNLCKSCISKVNGLKKCGLCERWRIHFSCEFFGWCCEECALEFDNWDISEKEWKERKEKAIKWQKYIPFPYDEEDLIQRERVCKVYDSGDGNY